MRKPKLPMGTPEDIEHAFYEAMHQADLDQLMDCWADEEDIVCVHPGGSRVVGAAAVRASFEALFADGGVHVRPESVRRLDAGQCAVHSVLERVDLESDDAPQTAWIQATNVYVKTVHGWRLVAHHASPGVQAETRDAWADLPAVLH